jgi:TatD DNase family protein
MLIDSHCHLNYKGLFENLDDVIKRASESGVKYMQTICTKISDFDDILNIIQNYDCVYGSFGIHPHSTDEESLTSDQIIEMSKRHPKIIGLGETGLDYYYENSKKESQIKSFIEHIKASQETKLPIIIHTREAESDTAEILALEMKNKEFKGLLHCFTSSEELAKKALDLGLYISISGICTFKNSIQLHDIIKWLPLDRILIETDAPFLAPIPMRGKTNEPSYVKYVAEKIAEIKNLSTEEVINTTYVNFVNLFKI